MVKIMQWPKLHIMDALATDVGQEDLFENSNPTLLKIIWIEVGEGRAIYWWIGRKCHLQDEFVVSMIVIIVQVMFVHGNTKLHLNLYI